MTSGTEENPIDPDLSESLVKAFLAGGKVRPLLPEGRRAEVIGLLTRLMVSPPLLREYAATLKAERRRRGVHKLLYELDPTEVPVEAIAERGLVDLSDDQLAELAIDPVALACLCDFLAEMMAAHRVGDLWWRAVDDESRRIPPEYFRPELKARLLAQPQRLGSGATPLRERVAPPSPRVLIVLLARPMGRSGGYRRAANLLSSGHEGDEVSDWALTTPQGDASIPLPSEVARSCYDADSQAVDIRLHRRPAAGSPDSFEPQLEVSPAPVRDALTCTVTLASGLQRELKVPVPRGRPRSAWSEPCEPLPSAAFGREGWELTVAFS